MNVFRPTHGSSQNCLSQTHLILGQWATQTYRDQVASSWLGLQNEGSCFGINPSQPENWTTR